MPHLTLIFDGDLAIVTLANPPQNRISPRMVDEFAAAIGEIGASDARALLVRAEGPDFSHGGDIAPWVDLSPTALEAMVGRFFAVFNAFESLPIPVIAAVQGMCTGGGLELAVRADVILAADTARFGHPEQSLGLVTLLGGVYRVAEKVGRAKAFEWAVTSELQPATEMERFGLVNNVVAADALASASENFARRFARGPTLAHAAHKALLRIWATGGVAAADAAMLAIAMPLFESADVRMALPAAIEAARAGVARPEFAFTGRRCAPPKS